MRAVLKQDDGRALPADFEAHGRRSQIPCEYLGGWVFLHVINIIDFRFDDLRNAPELVAVADREVERHAALVEGRIDRYRVGVDFRIWNNDAS